MKISKNYLSRLLLVLTLMLISSAIGFAQNLVKANLKNFNTISVSGSVIVNLFYGNDEGVIVKKWEGLTPEDIYAEVIDSALIIKTKLGKDIHVTMDVHSRYIRAIKTLADAEVYMSSTDTIKTLKIDAITGSRIDLKGHFIFLDIDTKNGGLVVLEGSCERMDADVSSKATLSAFDMVVKFAEVNAYTGANAKVNVKESIIANASGAGKINVMGKPAKQFVKKNLGGDVLFEE